jgi:hypothetical protein
LPAEHGRHFNRTQAIRTDGLHRMHPLDSLAVFLSKGDVTAGPLLMLNAYGRLRENYALL